MFLTANKNLEVAFMQMICNLGLDFDICTQWK